MCVHLCENECILSEMSSLGLALMFGNDVKYQVYLTFIAQLGLIAAHEWILVAVRPYKKD